MKEKNSNRFPRSFTKQQKYEDKNRFLNRYDHCPLINSKTPEKHVNDRRKSEKIVSLRLLELQHEFILKWKASRLLEP